jgi:hypothetical protein
MIYVRIVQKYYIQLITVNPNDCDFVYTAVPLVYSVQGGIKINLVKSSGFAQHGRPGKKYRNRRSAGGSCLAAGMRQGYFISPHSFLSTSTALSGSEAFSSRRPLAPPMEVP